ncbi:MAG TPA: NifU family protein [Selenomonadales bacterium]|nr:NifU family protein [Selenomonadales bacterium]
MKRVEEILAQKVRPVLNAHNGDIELLEVTPDGYVKVKLTGACSACPGAQQTLSEVVEAALKEACPEIKGVIPVFQVSDDLIQAALKLLRKG